MAIGLALAWVSGTVHAEAKTRPASNCVAASDPAHDEDPPPQAVGFDRGSLDVLGLDMSAEAQVVHVVITVRSLRQPIQPPGQNVSYRVFWTMSPPQHAEGRFSLDADLDGSLASFTLGVSNVDTRTNQTGDSYEQVGGPLSGAVDDAHGRVTVDVPRKLLAPYASGTGRVLHDISFSSWHGVGNPMVGMGNQVYVGSSGYRKVTDTADAIRQLDLTATHCLSTPGRGRR